MNIIPFFFEKHEIRTVQGESGLEVVAKDVAEALGYEWNARLLDKVPQEWKGVKPIHTPGGAQQMSTLTEQGLYFFLGRSDKPGALPMQKWVAGEVLPSIRKTGAYSMPSKPTPGLLPGPAREFRAAHSVAKLIGLKGNQAALAANKATARITGINFLQTLGAEKLADESLDPHLTVTEIGARLGLTAAAVNNLLIEAEYQTRTTTKTGKRTRHRYTPTDKGQRYAVLVDMDKAHVAGKPIQNLEWKASIMPRLALAMKKEVV